MKVGFFTACLAGLKLEDLFVWGAAQGFEALELAAWPMSGEGYHPSHIDASAVDDAEKDRIKHLCLTHEMTISSLGFYENPLGADPQARDRFVQHVRSLIDIASRLEIETVGTFTGADPLLTPGENLRQIGQVFRPLAAFAEDRGVKLVIENCPMLNWQRFGLPGNFAYSPELWDALFEEVPNPNFGLNLDPSHLHWLGIDVRRAIVDYSSRIFHTHAKDTEMLPLGRYRFGVLAHQLTDNPWVSGWWRYRIPGRGEIDWSAVIGTLTEVGYSGVMSIEHEDPELEGTTELVKEGLTVGLRHLQECRLAVEPAYPA